jgi:hypothetical protein
VFRPLSDRSQTRIAPRTTTTTSKFHFSSSQLGQRLPEYKLAEEEVLLLLERVNEAQRLATRELKEQLATRDGNRKSRGGKKGRYEGGDGDDETNIREGIKSEYMGGSGGRGGGFHNQRGGRGRGGGGKNGGGGRGRGGGRGGGGKNKKYGR